MSAEIAADTLAMPKQSTSIIYDGSLTVQEWFIIHAARTNCIPLNFRPGRDENQIGCPSALVLRAHSRSLRSNFLICLGKI